MAVLNRAILEVTEHYVEPERIDHQRMLLAGLNAIQRSVAPVMVAYQEGATLAVQVNDQRREFLVAVNSLVVARSVSARSSRFLAAQPRRRGREPARHRVRGGQRHAPHLDPHTVLLTPDIFEEMQMSTCGEFGGPGERHLIRDGHSRSHSPDAHPSPRVRASSVATAS
ncbi:MAG: hypothetical protein R3B99_35045 [Polyangiales bacterium]